MYAKRIIFGLLISIFLLVSAGLAPADTKLTPRQKALLAGARSCIGDSYDPGYYTGGVPPRGRSCCADVIYWAYKKIGIDLRDLVDKAIRKNPGLFPSVRNKDIDYRWVPNLWVFFKSHGKVLTNHVDLSNPKLMAHWQPGDIVVWDFFQDGGDKRGHIGIISDKKNSKGLPLVIHNCGIGAEDDRLLAWPIVGHFRY